MRPVRTMTLLGSEHPELGDVEVGGLPPRATAALTRGRFPKGYPYTDPNEDAVVVAADGEAWLVCALDGHSGFDAARAAAEALEGAAGELLASAPGEAAAAAHRLALEAVVSACEARDDDRRWSRTALAVAVVAGGQVGAVGAGDCVALVVDGGDGRALTEPGPFLGLDHPPGYRPEVATAPFPAGGQVICATDGLVDFLGRDAFRRIPDLADRADPAEAVWAMVHAAFAGGAGDNIAIALLR